MSEAGRPDPATEAFVTHRNLLFTAAYELLGSATDAEDVLHETWLRWSDVDLDTVQDQRAYLVRVATRQALALTSVVDIIACAMHKLPSVSSGADRHASLLVAAAR